MTLHLKIIENQFFPWNPAFNFTRIFTYKDRMAEVEGGEQSLGLGDIIEIIGGRLNKTRGKIYELSDKRLAILPIGATDRTIKEIGRAHV